MLSSQRYCRDHRINSEGEITSVTQRKNTQGGFTLIELMIVVGIIGIIAAIALPAYGRYVERTHIADGQRLLLDAAQWLERQYTVNNSSYPANLNAFAGTSDFYDVALGEDSGGQTYTLRATATNKRGDTCNIMEIDQTGAPLAGAECW